MSDEDTSGQSGIGEGSGGDEETVTLTRGELNKLQAKARVTEKNDAKAAKAAAEAEKAELKRRLKAAEEVGVADDLRQVQDENAELKAQLQQVNTSNAIRDAAGTRKWTLSAQRMAQQLVNPSTLERDANGVPTPESLESALDQLAKDYPDVYVETGQSGDDDKDGGKRKAVQTPANPAAQEENRGAKFKGYISPEEYMRTPFKTRQTADFRKRLEESRQHWPDIFNHREL